VLGYRRALFVPAVPSKARPRLFLCRPSWAANISASSMTTLGVGGATADDARARNRLFRRTRGRVLHPKAHSGRFPTTLEWINNHSLSHPFGRYRFSRCLIRPDGFCFASPPMFVFLDVIFLPSPSGPSILSFPHNIRPIVPVSSTIPISITRALRTRYCRLRWSTA